MLPISLWKYSPLLNITSGVLLTCLLGITLAIWGLNTVTPGPDSLEALHHNQGEIVAMKEGLGPHELLVLRLRHPTITYNEPEFTHVRELLYRTLKSMRIEENEVRTSGTTGSELFKVVKTLDHTLLEEEKFISPDQKATLFIAESGIPTFRAHQLAASIINILTTWHNQHPEFQLSYFSNGILGYEIISLINSDLDSSLIYTVPFSLIILLFAFRTIAADILTLLITACCLICSLGVTCLVSRLIMPVSATAAQLVVLLVMAITTDYTLFIINRVRSDVSTGMGFVSAIGRAMASTGEAVFWSGITVALSLSGLFLMGDSVLSSMALTATLSVLISLAFTLIILPSALCILERRIEWGTVRLPIYTPKYLQSALIRWSCKHTVTSIALTLLLICFLSWSCLFLKLGNTVQPHMLPATMKSAAAYTMMQKDFSDSIGMTFSVILSSPNVIETDWNDDWQELFSLIEGHPNIHGPINISRSKDGKTVRYNYVVSGDSSDPTNRALITDTKMLLERLQTTSDVQGYVSGNLDYDVSEGQRYMEKTPMVFGVVLFFSGLLLMVAFRSLVIPIKAILLNLLSTSASFGCLVLFFQEYGFSYGAVESFVPALLFSILFGLSMDYHVLLLSRITEEKCKGVSIENAILSSVEDTFGVVTSAAAIMISVFLVIASLQLPIMKQLGLGLACAVFLDVTIIRCVLLPASMMMLGDWNWYLPRWLRRFTG